MALWLVAAVWPLGLEVNAPPSRVLKFADGSDAYVDLSRDDKWRVPARLDRIDPRYLQALIAIEDERFAWHPGVDPLAIVRAVASNLGAGRVVSGASTISMQLARLSDPAPRTLANKFAEAFRAMQIEWRMDKDALLEAYLTRLPFGRNLEGLEAASLAYFGHRAKHLAPGEIAYLLSVPQNPNKRYPHPARTKTAKLAIAQIARRLFETGVFSEVQLNEALAFKPPERMRAFPRRLPHLARYLFVKFPEKLELTSTVSARMQALCEEVVADHAADLHRHGIYNAGVVLVDPNSGKVLAAVGNLAEDGENGEAFFAPMEPRSPGSTLKPFIFAQAIERGLVLPSYVVADIPTTFRDFEPENYDQRHLGLITLAEALSLSRNIPFIRLLQQVGTDSFLDFLRRQGVTSLNPTPGYYGLSVASGGIELNLMELAGLYAVLAAGGVYHPQQLLKAEGEEIAGQRVISAEVAWMTRQALARRDRPDFPSRRRFSELAPQVFWKTGTSFGHRDALSIGGTPQVVAAVWLGNLDFKPAVSLVGAEMAGPVLFDVLDAVITRHKDSQADPPPSGLAPVKLCSTSGRLAGPHCPETHTELAPVSQLPSRPCDWHRKILVDAETGLRLTPTCRPTRARREETALILPADYRRWATSGNFSRQAAPAFDPACDQVMESHRPVVLNPRPNTMLRLIAGLPAHKQEIPLDAVIHTADARAWWFVDGELLDIAEAGESLWWTPSPGEHELRVMDSQGQTTRINLSVLDH